MNCRNQYLIPTLVESRKEENIRIHNQYVCAMELRTSNDPKHKELIETILSDFPVEEKSPTHNFD